MIARLARLSQTFTFRLALVYVLLFSFSTVVLFSVIYIFADRTLETQARDGIRVRYQQLFNEYRDLGSNGVEERIEELIKSDQESTEIYLLINRDGEKLAGNMDNWPQYAKTLDRASQDSEWIRFYIQGSRTTAQTIEVIALSVPLSRWRTLLVGQSLQNQKRVEQTILQTFGASMLVTVVMALLGALVMTKSVERRITVINRSAAKIMQGALSERIPVTEGGDEFDELSSNLNAMLERIETLLVSLREFANNIAHDLRTPLNRIIARTETGLRHVPEDSTTSELLIDNIRDMQELIATFNAILSISELEANPTAHALQPINLSSIVDKMVEFYEPSAIEKSIVLTSQCSENLWISGEKHLLTQAIANVLDNAIKFTPEGGCIQVLARRHENFVRLSIADSGHGIPAAMRNKVFEKFFRLEQSRHSKGNGLGLSLVAAIARIHNASMALEDNNPGLIVRIDFAAEDVDEESFRLMQTD